MDIQIIPLEIKRDGRGWLAEILRREHVHESFGQFYLTTAHPGIVKGNHFHNRKTEFFCVIKGKGLLVLQDNNTEEKKEIILGEDNLITVKISPGITHAIKNIGQDMLYLLAYITEPFNEKDPDTFKKEILE